MVEQDGEIGEPNGAGRISAHLESITDNARFTNDFTPFGAKTDVAYEKAHTAHQ